MLPWLDDELPSTLTSAYNIKRKKLGSFNKTTVIYRKCDHRELLVKRIKSKSSPAVPLEILVMSKLSHPNLLQYESSHLLPSSWLLITELPAQYITLQSFITTRGYLSNHYTKDIFKQIYQAITYCFSNKIYLPVTLDTILIQPSTRHVKLTGFSTATVCSNSTKPQCSTSGSPYSPPELHYTGLTTPLAKATWSLGCITYAMAMGTLPFSSFKETVSHNILSFAPPHVKSQCWEFISGLLVKDPKKRVRYQELGSEPWVKDSTACVFKYTSI